LLRAEPLRNPAITAALATALSSGDARPLFAVLCRFSGLPGPRANDGLALAVGRALAEAGEPANRLVDQLCAVDARSAPADTVTEYLPMVGAFCHAARFVTGSKREGALAGLRNLAEDPRHNVRDAVIRSLLEMSRAAGDELVESLGQWTDGYLSAAVALAALAHRSWLDRTKSSRPLLTRFDEAFSLAEEAPRADQRSQGFRTLVRALSETPAVVMARFPADTIAWLESRAATTNVDLRASVEELVEKARAHGHKIGALEGIEQQLDSAAKPRRDPKTYVGPTRKRGSRRR
jgi:hypothetical protein